MFGVWDRPGLQESSTARRASVKKNNKRRKNPTETTTSYREACVRLPSPGLSWVAAKRKQPRVPTVRGPPLNLNTRLLALNREWEWEWETKQNTKKDGIIEESNDSHLPGIRQRRTAYKRAACGITAMRRHREKERNHLGTTRKTSHLLQRAQNTTNNTTQQSLHCPTLETCRPSTLKNRRVTGISFIFVPASVIPLPDKLSLHTPPVWHQLTKIRSPHLKSFLSTCPHPTSEGASPFAVSTYCRPQDFGRAVSPPSERLQLHRQPYRRA